MTEIIKGKGQKLWRKAKGLIPGGNQLLSKRGELFLPELWPSYYSRAKGCEIWDLDGNGYFDFAGMGVTACVLGYSDSDVNSAVKKAIDEGSMGTLNSFEEVQLVEKLIEIHEWAEMARFSKTGGEACSIAIRIARAASGKDLVAFCGYHGWHDWYLSANISDSENLTDQLLPGLDTRGVSRNLKGTAIPFHYNDLASFMKVIEDYGERVGAVIMEPQRGLPPDKDFLETIRKITYEKNIVLIFDEVTSGFHNNYGGLHLELGVNPDMAIFAKAMANGFPISAIIGKSSIMDSAQETFISSTMWTERIGFVAALASLQKMEKFNVQKHLVEYGLKLKAGWSTIANSNSLDISIGGLDAIPNFTFNYDNSIELLTYFNQCMLERGYLATGFTATTYSYSNHIIEKYLQNCDEVFDKISSLNCSVSDKLKGPLKHTTFSRLTG